MSQSPTILERISDDLVLRTATPEDADNLFDFHEEVFMHEESGTRAWWIAEWAKDLITKPHPTFSPSDCLIVEDTRNQTIASSTLYLTQEWQTDGATFSIGRPEIVGTRTPYRNQGLIRNPQHCDSTQLNAPTSTHVAPFAPPEPTANVT